MSCVDQLNIINIINVFSQKWRQWPGAKLEELTRLASSRNWKNVRGFLWWIGLSFLSDGVERFKCSVGHVVVDLLICLISLLILGNSEQLSGRQRLAPFVYHNHSSSSSSSSSPPTLPAYSPPSLENSFPSTRDTKTWIWNISSYIKLFLLFCCCLSKMLIHWTVYYWTMSLWIYVK